MADLEPRQITNLDGYGSAELAWSRAADQLRAGALRSHTSVLSTTRPDGRPHAMPVGALWHEDELYFVSGPNTRKSRNLASQPACTFFVSLDGIDLSLDGEAARVVDPMLLREIAARYHANGWPAEAAGDAITAPYSAPAAGPAPWYAYRFTFHTAFGTATSEPYGATRWRFGGSQTAS